MNMITLGGLLLLAGGLVNAIPPLATGLTGMFGGTPVIQIVVGAMSVILGLVILIKKAALS